MDERDAWEWRRGRGVGYLVCAAVAAGVLAGDLTTPANINWSAAYGAALAALAWTRSARAVWLAAAGLLALTVIGAAFGPPPVMGQHTWRYVWMNRSLSAATILAAAAVVHLWVRGVVALDAARRSLTAQNEELAAREEEIAQQNEELQGQSEELRSQSEELERQGEELRQVNGELERRQRALEALLELSQALGRGQMSTSATMDRICVALSQLVNDHTMASAILERRADGELGVRCHHGFGPAGLREEVVPYARSLAGLVIERNEAAALEDVTLRPDLVVPQPKEGRAMASVLAAPLRVRGRAVGSVEVYSAERRAWSDEQFSMAESLAAQASISLETAALFEEVEEQRSRFETVFRALPIGVAVADAALTDLRVNPAGAAMLGVPEDANLASAEVRAAAGFPELHRGGRRIGRGELAVERAARRGEATTGEEVELVFPAAGGPRRTLLVGATPFRDRSGAVTGAVAAFTDVTALKALQRELDDRRREAEEASVRKTRFLAAVSHDVRTPANAISLMAELIRRTAMDPARAHEVPQLCDELKGSAAMLSELVSDVLDVARFDSGKVELSESEFDLGALLADEARNQAAVARQKGLALEAVAPRPPLWVRADRVKLGRVVANLASNAVKFTGVGRVRLAAGRNGGGGDGDGDGGVWIAVSDTGVGIHPDQQARIFDEFYQLRNPERDRNKGTGLGLAICSRLVEAMGGSIEVASEVGRGSTFTVRLPASAVAPAPRAADDQGEAAGEGPLRVATAAGAGTGAAAEEEAADGQGPSPRLNGLRIVLVEDHDHTRGAAAAILRSEGAEVYEAPDGREGLRLIRERRPGLLLLDLMLPDLDGWEVLRLLRDARPEELRHILVLSGDLVSVPAAELRTMGVDAVCPKPVEVAALLQTIATVAAGMDWRATG